MKEIYLLLVGGFIGAFAGFGFEILKNYLERRAFAKQLRHELTTNLHMLPLFRQHLAVVIDGAQKGFSTNMRAVHFCTACYEAHFSTVLPSLSQSEQISFQIIYEYLYICNETTDAYAAVVFSTTERTEYSRQLKLYLGRLQDIDALAAKTEKYIRKHLDGTPTDFLKLKAEQSVPANPLQH